MILSKDKSTLPQKWKDKNKPVTICTIKNKPNNDPKFQKYLRLLGDGKSTKEPLIIFKILSSFRIDNLINHYLIYQINPLIRHLIK